MSRLRAPSVSGEIVSAPERREWPALVRSNIATLATSSAQVGGLSIQEWHRAARRFAIKSARAYAYRLGGASPGWEEGSPVIVTGHQPELFHPGVWIKSFATCGLARIMDGVGLHILTDNDTFKRPTVSVPAGTGERPLVEQIALDRWQGEIPFEERTVLDEAMFADFGAAASRRLASRVIDPVLPEFWASVASARRFNLPLGERLAFGRRRLETEWGAGNLETTLSRLCGDPHSFGRFAAEVLLRLPQFVEIHNSALGAYRRLHKIRSRHHPAPALEIDGDWFEAPFWMWNTGDSRRRRPFVRRSVDALEIRVEREIIARVGVSSADPCGAAGEQLVALAANWKLRPRALLTTGFLRLGVADLFIHGIGGGNYDQMTDVILQKFWQAPAPAYVVLTATLKLPAAGSADESKRSIVDCERVRRDLIWNPDRHLDDVLREHEAVGGWIERKHALMGREGAVSSARVERFREFRRLNHLLARYVGRQVGAAEASLQQAREEYSRLSLLDSREFAFCLHPAKSLQALMLPILGG